MNARLTLAAGVAVLTLAGCGAATVTSPTVAPTVPPTAAPTPASIAVTSGSGDTSANPDSTYVCADAISLGDGIPVAYLTAAGNDAAATAGCSAVKSPLFAPVNTIPADTVLAVPGCFVTANGATFRIYTDAANGDATTTATLCSGLIQGFKS